MKANFYSVTDTVNFPTTPSYNFTSTIYVPNVFICSGKTIFFLSTFILNCYGGRTRFFNIIFNYYGY